jgi:4a-hydroxytetrahydrobiopterin dehydratase
MPATATGWRRQGDALVRDLELRDFESALRLVEHVAAEAVDHFRRPDMCISEFNRVRLTIENPHHAGITPAETRLAARVEEALERRP